MDFENETPQVYETTQLPLVATLSCYGYQESEMSAQGRSIIFSYFLTDELSQIIKDYDSGLCKVEPKKFLETHRIITAKVVELKNRMGKQQLKLIKDRLPSDEARKFKFAAIKASIRSVEDMYAVPRGSVKENLYKKYKISSLTELSDSELMEFLQEVKSY